MGILVATSLVACRGGEEAATSSDPRSRPTAAVSASTATATATATASASAAPADSAGTPPRYTLVGRLPGDAALFDGGEVLVGCEARCAVPLDVAKPMPKVFVVDASGSREDASLSIEGAHGVSRKQLENDEPTGLRVQYFAGPNDVLFASYTYDHQGSGTTTRYDRSLRRAGGKWVVAEFEHPPSPALANPRGPDLDEARAHAPGEERLPAPKDDDPYARLDALVFGGGGPVLLLGEAETSQWDGKGWKRMPKPLSKPISAARLASGATFVAADGGGWWLSTTGAPQPIALEGVGPSERLEVHVVRGALWLAARGAEAVKVFAPADPRAVAVAPPPPAAPSTPTRADGEPMPAPTNATPGCATPFVMISSAKTGSLPDYPITRAALKGHADLQDALTFVDFERDGTLSFGAQATTADAADKLVAILEEKVKGMKPVRGCLDAKSRLDDKQHAARAFRLVLNLERGTFVARR